MEPSNINTGISGSANNNNDINHNTNDVKHVHSCVGVDRINTHATDNGGCRDHLDVRSSKRDDTDGLDHDYLESDSRPEHIDGFGYDEADGRFTTFHDEDDDDRIDEISCDFAEGLSVELDNSLGIIYDDADKAQLLHRTPSPWDWKHDDSNNGIIDGDGFKSAASVGSNAGNGTSLEMTVSNGDTDIGVPGSDPVTHQLPIQGPTLIHPCVDPPLCPNCTRLELSFFDPACPECREILVNPSTTVPEIFAILRQWTPQTQQSIELLVDEVLKRGANINDRDGLTDMTLLHYASKSGAAGIGDPEVAKNVVSMLIEAGADANIRCRWTNMSALHYAAYFDVTPVIRILLKATKALDIDSTCSEFEHGTALHIAASNLAYDACKLLLQSGGSPALKDDLGRRPVDCVPDPESFEKDSELNVLVAKLRLILGEALPSSPKPLPVNYDLVQSKVTLQALGLSLGDKILVGGVKSGVLRYCGPAEFSTGIWAGIELDEPAGKNNGSVGGICYFTCADNHGIFAPISKVTKLGIVPRVSTPPASRNYISRELSGVDVSKVTAKVDTGLTKQSSMDHGLDINDRVIVAGQRRGTIRFIGETRFAPGVWYGVELDKPAGKNNGSVNGINYFTCKPKHGVFAPITRIQKLGDRRFSSNESLDTISWGAVSERVERRPTSGLSSGRSRTPTRSVTNSKNHLDLSRVPGKAPGQVLEVGLTVLCNNELGVVRFMGSTEFGEGTWLGVELRKPKGKNDGSVQGTRYFTCPPDHGLLVKPSRVTVRGINGAKLLAEQNSMSHTMGRSSHNGSFGEGSHLNSSHSNSSRASSLLNGEGGHRKS